MSEHRIIEIETRLAYQDQLLADLNDVVTVQQKQIMQLEELCRSIVERVRDMAHTEPMQNRSIEPPPHY